nr:hypothetical protein [Paraburkholderia terrae]
MNSDIKDDLHVRLSPYDAVVEVAKVLWHLRSILAMMVVLFCFFRSSSGCAAGSSAGAGPAKRTLDARGVTKLVRGWLRQNAA